MNRMSEVPPFVEHIHSTATWNRYRRVSSGTEGSSSFATPPHPPPRLYVYCIHWEREKEERQCSAVRGIRQRERASYEWVHTHSLLYIEESRAQTRPTNYIKGSQNHMTLYGAAAAVTAPQFEIVAATIEETIGSNDRPPP